MADQTITFTTGIPSSFEIGEPDFLSYELNDFLQQTRVDIKEGFLNEDDFAEPVKFIYSTGETPLNTFGIIDEEYLVVTPETEVGMMSSDPFVIMQSSQFIRRPDEGDTLIMRGKKYKVMREEPDGTDISLIYFKFLK